MDLSPLPATRVLRLKEFRALLKIGKTTMHEGWRPGSKYFRPDFPPKHYIGRTPYVLERDVEAYILAHTSHPA
jgi:predicted DNA-binding transcriptional regulator AlpA